MKIFDKLNPTNTLSVNRLLAHKLGLNAAVVYAALVAKQAYYAAREMLDKDGYFYSTEDDLKESTSLSRAQQDRVIDILLDAGLIEKDTRGMPAKRCFRVVDDENLLTSLLETDNQVCEKVANKIAENSQTSLSESSNHTYKTKDNKSKVNPINQRIGLMGLILKKKILLISGWSIWRLFTRTSTMSAFLKKKRLMSWLS